VEIEFSRHAKKIVVSVEGDTVRVINKLSIEEGKAKNERYHYDAQKVGSPSNITTRKPET